MAKRNSNILIVFMLLFVHTLVAQTIPVSYNNYNEELGIENLGRFLNKSALECRLIDNYYTQDDYYNVRWLRVTDDKRVYSNTTRLSLQYGLTKRLLFRITYQNQKTLQGKNFSKPFEYFKTKADQKAHFNDIAISGQYLLSQKKRWVLAGTAIMPVYYKLPKYNKSSTSKFVRLHATILYDAYPTTFMRMQLNNTFEFSIGAPKNVSAFVCSPDARFLFTIWRNPIINITALTHLIFRINQSNNQPFTGRQGLVINGHINKSLDLNTQYIYNFIGENTGAGHTMALSLTLRLPKQTEN
ncbi:MAG: hypothetical protein JNK61_12640 [Bacteroidia bacterium]|nr:hypothetical protein [Bacteroidia bacterium]